MRFALGACDFRITIVILYVGTGTPTDAFEPCLTLRENHETSSIP